MTRTSIYERYRMNTNVMNCQPFVHFFGTLSIGLVQYQLAQKHIREQYGAINKKRSIEIVISWKECVCLKVFFSLSLNCVVYFSSVLKNRVLSIESNCRTIYFHCTAQHMNYRYFVYAIIIWNVIFGRIKKNMWIASEKHKPKHVY